LPVRHSDQSRPLIPAFALFVTRKIRCAQKRILLALSTRIDLSRSRVKNIPLGVSGKSAAPFRASRLAKGRIAIVTDVEAGSGGRETSQHASMIRKSV
jgi:hypothetical protein